MSEQPRSFDPTGYLTKIRTKQGMQPYLAVKHRVMWLRAEHSDARIEVEKVDGGLEAGWVEFRCTVIIPSTGASATDYGSETKQDFPDYYEKAATKATGRALAILGYGTDAAPDLDAGEPVDGRAAAKDEREERRMSPDERAEVDSQHARNTQPTPMRPPPSRRQREAQPAPESGERHIRETAAEGRLAPPPDTSNIHQHAQLTALSEAGYDLAAQLQAFGVERMTDLTREQAKEVIIAGRAVISQGRG